jgi:4-amino-4-deoxy-L-arabinose transferase-like glycosyltransferase
MDILIGIGGYLLSCFIWVILPATIIRLLLNPWLKRWSRRAVWWVELGIVMCLLPVYALNFYTLSSASVMWTGGYTDNLGKVHGFRFYTNSDSSCHWHEQNFPCRVGWRDIEIRDASGVIVIGKANWNNTVLELRPTKTLTFLPQTITLQRYHGDH